MDHILFIIILANSSMWMKSLFTSSESPRISSISCSSMRSPIVCMACLKSLTVILSLSPLANTLSASIKSYRVSLSLGRSWTAFSSAVSVKNPLLLGSTFCFISLISSSVGLRFNALIKVPNSDVATWPRLLLSNNANISFISFDVRVPANVNKN
jgi:hypothetical protein